MSTLCTCLSGFRAKTALERIMTRFRYAARCGQLFCSIKERRYQSKRIDMRRTVPICQLTHSLAINTTPSNGIDQSHRVLMELSIPIRWACFVFLSFRVCLFSRNPIPMFQPALQMRLMTVTRGATMCHIVCHTLIGTQTQHACVISRAVYSVLFGSR